MPLARIFANYAASLILQAFHGPLLFAMPYLSTSFENRSALWDSGKGKIHIHLYHSGVAG